MSGGPRGLLVDGQNLQINLLTLPMCCSSHIGSLAARLTMPKPRTGPRVLCPTALASRSSFTG